MNPYARPAYEDRADDLRQLMALSMLDDLEMSASAIGEEFDVTRNTALGWLNRIMAADAKAHGLDVATEDQRERYRAHRRVERAGAMAS